MKKNSKEIKKILSVVLASVLSVSIFAGMKVDSYAYSKDIEDIPQGATYHYGSNPGSDQLTLTQKTSYDVSIYIEYANGYDGKIWIYKGNHARPDEANEQKYITGYYENILPSEMDNTSYVFNRYAGDYTFVVNECYVAPPTAPTPTPEEESFNYLDALNDKLNTAIENKVAGTIEWAEGDSLPLEVMEVLSKNPGISLLFSFTYDGVDHKVMIPAGKAVVDEKIKWYGPCWLLQEYGEYNKDAVLAGNKYTVSTGDTFSSIAAKCGLTIEELKALNPQITDINKIFPGQVINF